MRIELGRPYQTYIETEATLVNWDNPTPICPLPRTVVWVAERHAVEIQCEGCPRTRILTNSAARILELALSRELRTETVVNAITKHLSDPAAERTHICGRLYMGRFRGHLAIGDVLLDQMDDEQPKATFP